MLNISLEEHLTGDEQRESFNIRIVEDEYTLECLDLTSLYFQPGVPYVAFVRKIFTTSSSLTPSLSLSLSLSLFPSARLIQSTNLTQSQFQLSKLTGDTRLGDDHLLRVDILYDGSNRETLRYAVPSDGIVMAEIPTNQTTTKLDVQAFVSHRPHPISRTSPRPQPHSINVDVTPRTSSFRTSRQLTGKICVVTIE